MKARSFESIFDLKGNLNQIERKESRKFLPNERSNKYPQVFGGNSQCPLYTKGLMKTSNFWY